MILQPLSHTIGIEIGQTMLRLVCVRQQGRIQQLLAAKAIASEGVAEAELVKQIVEFITSQRLKNYRVVNIVPSGMVITKNIEVPSTSAQEIREIVNLQAGRHTPFAREEVIVSHLPIGVYKKNYTKILMVIMNVKVVKKQLDMLEKAGLRVSQSIYAAETLALYAARQLRLDSAGQPLGLVHIDRDATDFLIIARGKLLFVRSLPVGRRQLNAEAQGEAQKAAGKFADELKKSLEAYQGEDVERAPVNLFLAGAVQGLSLAGEVEQSLHLPVKTVDYLRSISPAAEAAQTITASEDASFLNLVSALALRSDARIDLIPEEIQMKKRLQQRGRDLFLMGLLVLAVFSLSVFIMITRLYYKSEYARLLGQHYSRLRLDTAALEKDLSRIILMRNYLAQQGYSLEVLTTLVELVPPEMELGDLRYDEQGRVSAKGTAASMSTVFSFVDALNKASCFSEVKTKYTTKRREEGKDVVDFEISATLKKKAAGL